MTSHRLSIQKGHPVLDHNIDARVLAMLVADPSITGTQIAERLRCSERTGRRLKARALDACSTALGQRAPAIPDPESTPERFPAPGDVVLVRATVAKEQPYHDGTLAVAVVTRSGETPLAISQHTIAEIVGPSWCPPKRHDVVIDVNGHVWQYEVTADDCGIWTSPASAARCTTTELMTQHGPLTLAFRDGELWDL